MTLYNFYFDESAHSRAITYKDGKGPNIYIQDKDKQNDLFVGCFIGVDVNKDFEIEQRFLMAERYIKSLLGLDDKEFKGETIKTNKFKNGFNSIGKNNLKIYQTVFKLLDDNDLIFHIHLLSKTEYLVREFFKRVRFPPEEVTGFVVDKKALMYTLIKFIFNYRKQDLLKKMFKKDQSISNLFLKELIEELTRIVESARDINRMKYEVRAFEQLLFCFSIAEITLSPKEKYEWDYEPLFLGFSNLLNELNITTKNIKLRIDPEGTNAIFHAANNQDFSFVHNDLNSTNSPMIRLADILSNLFYKISYNLYDSLKEQEYKDASSRDFVTKRLIEERWFDIKQKEVYLLYVQADKVFKDRGDIYWTTFSGLYIDFALLTFSLLRYIGGFYDSFDEYKTISPKMHAEYFNVYVTSRLKEYFDDLD